MKRHTIVKLFAYVVIFSAVMPLVADTENVDGVEWQYIIEANTVTIVGDAANWKSAIPKTTTGVLTVPSTLGGYPVRRIGDWAFGRCDGLTTVIIPEGIEHIGSSAFCDCSGLTGITIPYGVTSIGDWAFLRCTSLTFARIPASVTNVGYSAFSICNRLRDVSLPSCIVSSRSYSAYTGDYSEITGIFTGCYDSITNVIVCDGVPSVREGTFNGWKSLRHTLIPNSVRNIGDYAFEGCSSLCNLQLPNVITNIGRMAFKDCQALTDLVLPENLTCLKSEAFRNCSGVTNVALNVGLEDIGDSAFYGCSSITRLEIPDSVTNIARYAFEYCRGVTNVILGKNLGKVGSYAFYPIAAEIVFRGNAPQIDTSGGRAFDTSCVAHVLYGSTGWGVEIPGIWNGMRIEYYAFLPLADDATAAEVAEALSGVADASLVANIADGTNYNAFCAWAQSVKDARGSAPIGAQTVKESANAWLSYAFAADALIDKELTSDDVQIESFAPASTDGKFEFIVSVKDVNIGGGSVAVETLKENLKKVLGIEGAATLSPSGFSSDNIDITFDAPVDGKAKFTVSPPADAGNSFFMRVKVK